MMEFLAQATSEINQFLQSPAVQGTGERTLAVYSSYLPLLKAASILLTLFFLTATLIFMIKTSWLPLRIDRVRDVILKTNLPKKRTVKAWRSVKRHFFKGDENSLKMALIEADKLLDEALKAAGFRGESLGDKLKKITEVQLPNLQEIWEAHKLRNRLVHEPNIKLNRDLAERALSIYQQTLRDFGILD